MRLLGVALGAVVGLSSCGYHVAGRADLVPKEVRTIAVPAFENATTRYRLTEGLPLAVGREFIARTRFHVVSDPEDADAVLEGTIVDYLSYPIVVDAGRAAGIQLIVVLNLRLLERSTGRVLFERAGMQVQNRYEISTDQLAYFDESDAALDRTSADAARTIVSAILEDF